MDFTYYPGGDIDFGDIMGWYTPDLEDYDLQKT